MSTTTIIIIIIIIITNTDTTVEDMAIPHSARFFLPFIPQVKKNPGNPIVQLLAYSCVAFPFIEEIVFFSYSLPVFLHWEMRMRMRTKATKPMKE